MQIETQVERHIFDDVRAMLKTFNPQLIIELGTYKGGFCNEVAEWFPNIPVITFDFVWLMDKDTQDETRRKNNITVVITQQLFKNDVILSLLLALPIRKFLFCDNGRKIDEVKLYAQCLRPGDLLGIHDWKTEIKPEDVGHILQEFDEHEINEKLSVPGHSRVRFFVRKKYQGKYKLSTAYMNMK